MQSRAFPSIRVTRCVGPILCGGPVAAVFARLDRGRAESCGGSSPFSSPPRNWFSLQPPREVSADKLLQLKDVLPIPLDQPLAGLWIDPWWLGENPLPHCLPRPGFGRYDLPDHRELR